MLFLSSLHTHSEELKAETPEDDFFCLLSATMKQHDGGPKQTNRRQTLDRLCSGSGLLLSVLCCIALIHVELRIQEHHRLIYHSVTFCDKLEKEILRKVEQNYGKRQVIATSPHRQTTKGRFRPPDMSNTVTNSVIALYCILLYSLVLKCIVLLIYCYVDIIQYNTN